jgi:hypothetical protein
MMDKVELCGAEQYRTGQRYWVLVRVSQVDSLGTVRFICKGLYTFGPHTGHGLCARSTEPYS